MMTRLHLSAVLLIAAAIWAGVLILDGVVLNGAWLRPFSIVITGLLVILAGFDRWLWHLRLLRGWFVQRPDVRGTWKVEVASAWKDPQSRTPAAPINAFLVVRQTFSALSARLYSGESASELLGAEIVKVEDGTFRIVGVYRNEPRLSVRERSPIHYGALLLNVAGNPATALTGHYWTDRDSKGEIRSVGHSESVAVSHQDAQRLFSGPSARSEGAPPPAGSQDPAA